MLIMCICVLNFWFYDKCLFEINTSKENNVNLNKKNNMLIVFSIVLNFSYFISIRLNCCKLIKICLERFDFAWKGNVHHDHKREEGIVKMKYPLIWRDAPFYKVFFVHIFGDQKWKYSTNWPVFHYKGHIWTIFVIFWMQPVYLISMSSFLHCLYYT